MRTLCQVLSEMRTCHETRNYSYLLSLIEEAQTLGNRMEAGLDEKHNIEYYRSQRKKLQREIAEMENRIENFNNLKDLDARIEDLQKLRKELKEKNGETQV